jgi:1-acyl-sn-glycerol-3-phosphate acyltransferase
VRTVFFWIMATLATILVAIELSIAAILGLGRTWVSRNIQSRWGHAVLFGAGVKVTVKGKENAKGGPFIVVPNHGSMLDIAAGLAHFGLNLRFLSRPFFFKIPFLGWSMWVSGHVSLDPKKPREAARVLRTLGPRLESGLSLVVFPEGTRSQDGEIHTYKRGPFLTAIQYQVPLLPVRIKGLWEVLPPGAKSPKPGKTEIIIGEPIPTKGLEPPAAKKLARDIEAWAKSV